MSKPVPPPSPAYVAARPMFTPAPEQPMLRPGVELPHTPQWLAEFPDLCNGQDGIRPAQPKLGIYIPHGWVDVSWSNDVCPSFMFTCPDGTQYRAFVDYVCPGDRELGHQAPRFRLASYDASGAYEKDVYETDDARSMSAFLALIALRMEVMDWQEALGGEREGLDELCSSCDYIVDETDELGGA